MKRGTPISRGCGQGQRFSSEAAAESAKLFRGAQGDIRQHGSHFHLDIPEVRLGFSAETKLLARMRAGNGEAARAVCEMCGERRGEDVHHRMGRGAGGCRDEVVNGLANALVACRLCHDLCDLESAAMEDMGFVIRRGNGAEFDPRFVSVMLHGQGSGMTVWLHESEPRYLTEDPRGASAA